LPRLPRSYAKHRRASQRSMLKLEGRASSALLSPLGEIFGASSTAGVARSAREIQSVAERVIARTRRAAREGSLDAIEQALELAAKVADVSGIDLSPIAGAKADRARAKRIAKSSADRFLERFDALIQAGESRGDALLHALQTLAVHLGMVAVTETAEAWSDESRRQGRRIERERRKASGTVVLVKEWDATLDRRTCPVCEGANGKIVLVGFDFPAGVPGGVHPRCRCMDFWFPVAILLPGERADLESGDYELAA